MTFLAGKRLPVSAIVAAFNEAYHIKGFLDTISFCDEINFFDLGSSDDTLQIAKDAGVKTYVHERVPMVEIIHYEFIDKVKYDWILISDPDERLSPALRKELSNLFDKGIPDEIGGIYAPWIFYFKKHRLKGTPWGGVNMRQLLFNRKKYTSKPLVHNGRTIHEPYIEYQIPYTGDNFIAHYWVLNYRNLFEKHWRYIKLEPESRYDRGCRTSSVKVLKIPFESFKYAYFTTKGYKDGFTGLFLSLFWAWYQTSSLAGLFFYQRKKEKNNPQP